MWGHHRLRTVPAASVLKAMLMVAYLNRREVRDRPLRRHDLRLLRPMIRRSDNTTASAHPEHRRQRGAPAPSPPRRHAQVHACRAPLGQLARERGRPDTLLPAPRPVRGPEAPAPGIAPAALDRPGAAMGRRAGSRHGAGSSTSKGAGGRAPGPSITRSRCSDGAAFRVAVAVMTTVRRIARVRQGDSARCFRPSPARARTRPVSALYG